MENVRTLVRGDDELIVALRGVRRRLVGTFWLSIILLLAAIMSWGLYAEWEQVRSRLTGAALILQMSHMARWIAMAPAVLLLILVVAERSRTLSRLVTHVMAVLLLLFVGGTAASLVLRAFIGTIPPTWAAFSYVALNWFAYDLMVFSVVIAAGYLMHLRLAQMEASVRLFEAQSSLEEETMRSGLTIEQSIVLVEILRQIGSTCVRSPRRATTVIVELGDLLRTLLAHLQRESVDLEDEVSLYEQISVARGDEGKLRIEITDGEELDSVRPGLVLVILLRLHRVMNSSHRVELERDRSCVKIRMDDVPAAEVRNVLLEIPELQCASPGVLTGTIAASGMPIEEPGRIDAVPAFLRAGGPGLIAIPFVLGLSIGFASAVSRWIGVEFFVPNVEMSTLRIFAVEFLEWIVWGSTGSLALMMARRNGWRVRSMVAASALWLLVGHVGIGVATALVFAPSGEPLLSTGATAFYTSRSLMEYDFGLRIAVLLVGVAIAVSVVRSGALIEAAAQERGLRQDQRLARIRSLRAQLQPHFLLNSLHTIVPLLEDDPEEASRSVHHLAELLDRSHRLAMAVLVPLEEEQAMACSYLQAVSLRFGDRVDLDIDVPDDLGDALVPALISQPLLENALVHGIERTTGTSSLSLRVHQMEGRLRLEIRNSTTGRRASAGRGIGIRNTVQALELCYGTDYRFESIEEEKQWVSRVDIPLRRQAPSPVSARALAVRVS